MMVAVDVNPEKDVMYPDPSPTPPPRQKNHTIVNIGLPYQTGHLARQAWRRVLRTQILPQLVAFNPDIIFLSSGFDGHKAEQVNWGYLGLLEHDYEWLTEKIVKVANTCCEGRIVSVLEGGYNFHGRVASPFARRYTYIYHVISICRF
jgi:acetoin utilization deacetylase AcuC-like enzyme